MSGGPVYPLRQPPDQEADEVVHAVADDVAAVFVRHGLPPLTHSMDMMELRQALGAFIYGDRR